MGRTFYFQTPTILDEGDEPDPEYTPPCEVLLSERDVDQMLAELTLNGTQRKRRSAHLAIYNKWSTEKPIQFAIERKDFENSTWARIQ